MTEYDGLAWFKSSYSRDSNDCVEAAWRKSSYSRDSDACVETAPGPDVVYLRDSKLGDASPILSISLPYWRSLLAAVRADSHEV